MSDYNRLENELEKVEKDINYIPYFIALMENYWDDDIKSCIEVIGKTLKIALAGRKYKQYIELSLILAKYYIEFCDYDGAMEILIRICESKEKPYSKFKSQELLLNANNLLCKLYCRTGNYDKGMSLGVKNIVYTQELLKPEIRINTILELANIAVNIRDYRQVDMALEDISNMDAMLTEKHKIHRDLIGLRKSIDVEDITWAIVYMNRVWDIVKENKHPYKLEFLHALELRAMLNQKRKLEVQAEKDYQEVDKLTKEIGHIYLYGKNKLRWSKYIMSKGKKEEAIVILNSLGKNSIIPADILKESYRQLASIYETKNEWELAYKTLAKTSNINEANRDKQPDEYVDTIVNKEYFDLNIDAMRCGTIGHAKNDEDNNKAEAEVEVDSNDEIINDINTSEQNNEDIEIDINKDINKDMDIYKYIDFSNVSDVGIGYKSINNNMIRYQDIPKNNALQNYENIYGLLSKLSQIGKILSKNIVFKGIDKELYAILKEIFRMEFVILKTVQSEDDECTVIHNGEEVHNCENVFREFKYLANYCIQERVNIKVGNANFYKYHTNQIEDLEGIVVSSVMIIPIFAGEKVVGSIGLASYKSNYFDRNDLCTLRILSSYIGMNLRSSDLFRTIKYLEDYDKLTGLLGRSEFMKKCEESFKYNQMNSKDTVIILFFVDELKHINDRYGYEVGDNILREVGEILDDMTEDIGYAGRYSGETFSILLNDVTEKDGEKFCRLVKKSLANREFETKKGKKVTITMSAGVYKCDAYTMRFTDAIKYAESALYRSKLLGNGYMMSYSTE